jgi:hypothetical protein
MTGPDTFEERAAPSPAKRMMLVSFVAYIRPAATPAMTAQNEERLLAYLHPEPRSAARKKTSRLSWM